MKKLLSFFLVLAFALPAFADQEIIADLKDRDIPVVNEELRRARKISDENSSALAALVTVPTGAIIIWTTDTAPTSFLLCYGQAVSRATYAALFAIVGTTFGVGDGSTTFNVPDLRGRFPLGKDSLGGSSANIVTATEADTIGSVNGAETHTLIIAEMPAHTHTTRAVSAVGSGTSGLAFQVHNFSQDYESSSTGGDGAHNIMNPYMTFAYIIKT